MLHPYAHYLQRWAQRDPDGGAVVDVAQDVRLTWRELAARVARLAAHLAADGVGPGSRVAVRQANTHAHVEAVCAIAWCGAAFVPTLHTLTDAEREHIHAEIEPAGHLDAREGFSVKIAHRDPVAPVQAGTKDLSSVLYTSGSTGAPKGVMHTMRSTQAAMAGWSRLTWRPESSKVLVTSPISHAAGRFFEAALVNGWSTVILDTARASAVLPAIERFEVSHALVVPTVLQEMVDSPLLGEHDLSSLAFLLYAAAPTSPSLVTRAQERLGPILHTVYGSTEAPAPNTHLDAAEHTRAIADDLPMLRSCGREFPFGVQLRLVDEEMRTIPEDGVGQLAMAASWNCAGFWRQPEAWAKRYHKGWILTGDVGRFEGGYLYLMDRADDMIISGGSNVYPTEIENVLSAHPSIREVVVFGEPHERWGESVLAVVATHTPLAESEIIDYCRPRLSAYKVPKRVVILDELPKSGVGKLSRKLAREVVLRDVARISGAR